MLKKRKKKNNNNNFSLIILFNDISDITSLMYMSISFSIDWQTNNTFFLISRNLGEELNPFLYLNYRACDFSKKISINNNIKTKQPIDLRVKNPSIVKMKRIINTKNSWKLVFGFKNVVWILVDIRDRPVNSIRMVSSNRNRLKQ